MSDPRDTPDPAKVTGSDPMQVILPLADLCRTPDGPRDRQLLCGDTVTVLHREGNWCLLRTEKDGYCGYLPAKALGPPQAPTHHVTARATHAYSDADMKSPERHSLSFGSRLAARAETATFIETDLGHIPRQHLHRIGDIATDPVAIARLFLGTPYLWGGNSAWGIDCSGLVQAACLACGLPCPGDSDQQETQLGDTLPAGTTYRRNDLLFWAGHVAWVQSPDTLLHANAGHMAVAEEPLEQAIARIAAQGDGPVTAHKRLSHIKG
ncbi:NlpC/P60 family protein [uncultured Roseobacter sp.]|uniref:C40 family peptidase n=1 Tax=uncultured Roseobacter sp. TaxID=114847 RepID=UPI0026352169|nr:NlpC/P60 family protein [uncultured Roseobacter sp.]